MACDRKCNDLIPKYFLIDRRLGGNYSLGMKHINDESERASKATSYKSRIETVAPGQMNLLAFSSIVLSLLNLVEGFQRYAYTAPKYARSIGTKKSKNMRTKTSHSIMDFIVSGLFLLPGCGAVAVCQRRFLAGLRLDKVTTRVR
eukprot:2398903-Amphidinium_carterae.1